MEQNSREKKSDPISEHEAESKQAPLPHTLPANESIQTRLEELQLENLALRKSLWRTKYRGTVPTGITLSGIGAACLLFSYLWSSSILTFIGLGLSLWGVLIIYMSSSRHVRAELLNSISSSMLKSIDSLVTTMGYSGRAIFFHPKSLTGLGQGYVFIPHYAPNVDEIINPNVDALNLLPYSSETSVPQIYLDPKGIFLGAPSQGIIDLFEKELGVNFALVNLEYIQEALPKLLIEELKLVDDMSIEEDSDTGDIAMRVSGGPCIDICQYVSRETRLGNHLGCPLCSVLALVISKVKGKPVNIKETNVTDNTIYTTYVILGP